MKRVTTILLAAGALVACSLQLRASTPAELFDPVAAAKADPSFDYATFKKLRVVVVDVNWNWIDLQSALDELSGKSRRLDPTRIGIRFRFKVPTNFDAKKYHRQVAMTLKDAPLLDVIEYISTQTNLIPLVHKNEVIMVPGVETRLKPDPIQSDHHWEGPTNSAHP